MYITFYMLGFAILNFSEDMDLRIRCSLAGHPLPSGGPLPNPFTTLTLNTIPIEIVVKLSFEYRSDAPVGAPLSISKHGLCITN
jgi:hypothetical protein